MTLLRKILVGAAFVGSVVAYSDAQAFHIPFFSKSAPAKPPAPTTAPKDSAAAASAKAALRTKQFATALRELQAAAEHGDIQSQYLLGLVYANGVGTDVSSELALHWLGSAADKAHAEAAFALSGLLADGTAQERAEAQRWLTRAAGSSALRTAQNNSSRAT